MEGEGGGGVGVFFFFSLLSLCGGRGLRLTGTVPLAGPARGGGGGGWGGVSANQAVFKERASQEEQNGANFNFIVHSSEEL